MNYVASLYRIVGLKADLHILISVGFCRLAFLYMDVLMQRWQGGHRAARPTRCLQKIIYRLIARFFNNQLCCFAILSCQTEVWPTCPHSGWFCRFDFSRTRCRHHQALFSNNTSLNNELCGFVIPYRRPEGRPTYPFSVGFCRLAFRPTRCRQCILCCLLRLFEFKPF